MLRRRIEIATNPAAPAMNYRHAFHAGNFADVVKHAVLARILVHLAAKPAPYRVIDTHAGAGRYDLAGPEALRGGEWHDGIGRVRDAAFDAPVRLLLAPYLDAVAACNPPGRLAVYPGSPAIVQHLLRSQDRLVACELEPGAAAALAREFAGDRRIKTIAFDGWTALNAYVPPKERRGLVLIDPPYEDAGDFPRLVRRLEAAHRKWASGVYLIWYPIKERGPADALARDLRRSGIAKVLSAEVTVAPPPRVVRTPASGTGESSQDTPPRSAPLTGCGLVVVNPPWTLDGELEVMLPALAAAMSVSGRGGARIAWLARDH
jgi:23S rRNA (adenine2030-N6)-methyltransferase